MNDPADREVAIFGAALQLPAGQRAAFLDEACAGDAALRQRVEAFLAAHEEARTFLEHPALGTVHASAEDGAPDPSEAPGLTAAPSEKAGDRIGRYKLLEQIGEGGCGVVYMAEQEEPVRRRVALKVIKLGMDTRQVIARFEAERQALALMDHPNIAKVLDAGTTETGRPYFVMELIKGIPITRFCDENTLATEQRLGLFIQVCQAIQHAHQKGIIHRDIKPSNILVADHDGVPVPKVIDFGIAKATNDQPLTDRTVFTAFAQFIGTPAYMSPEQAKLSGVDIDTRSDIYSLGVLLYELLTGKTPFEPEQLVKAGLDEIRRIIQEEEPMRPSTKLQALAAAEQTAVAKRRQTQPPKLINQIRGDLDWIVIKALEKDRRRRYETANGLARDVERYLGNELVTARPPSKFYELQKLVRRNKVACFSVLAITTILVVGSLISTLEAVRATRAEHEQDRLRRDAVAASAAQAKLRVQAERDGALARSEAQRAETAAAKLKTTLAASDFSQAVRFIAEDDRAKALTYLARVLAVDPANTAALTYVATILTYHTWTIPTLSITNEQRVSSAQFSPDGERLVTASVDHNARVWSARTGEPLTAPLKHRGTVYWAQFSPDGRRIVTASGDGTAQVWDATTGLALGDPLQHTSAVVSAQFSTDGQRVVTASEDHTARVWNSADGRQLTPPLRHGAGLRWAEFSSDGRSIVSASWDHTARVWDARTGDPLSPPLKHDSMVWLARFSPDGKQVVTASADGTARVWDALTGQQVGVSMRHDNGVRWAEFSPNGDRIVTGSFDNTARAWNSQSGAQLGESLKHNDAVWSAHFSPDGRRVITSSFDTTAQVWEAPGLGSVVQPVSDIPSESLVVFSSVPMTPARVTPRIKHNASVVDAQFSPDGSRIVTVSANSVRVWDGLNRPALPVVFRHDDSVSSAQLSPDGRRVVTASNDHARVWDSLTGQPLTGPLKHNGGVGQAEFSRDGQRVVTASVDHTARVWDAQTGQPLPYSLRHEDQVRWARFSGDGRRIVTASSDHTARVWDAQTGQPLTPPMKHLDLVRYAEFSPDGKRIATASFDNTARIWDAESGQPLTKPLQHGANVRSAHFSPDGRRLAVRIFDPHLALAPELGANGQAAGTGVDGVLDELLHH